MFKHRYLNTHGKVILILLYIKELFICTNVNVLSVVHVVNFGTPWIRYSVTLKFACSVWASISGCINVLTYMLLLTYINQVMVVLSVDGF